MSEQPVSPGPPGTPRPHGNPVIGVLIVIVVLAVGVLVVMVGATVWGAFVGFVVDLASVILVAIARLFGKI
jgi:hypothetical protein